MGCKGPEHGRPGRHGRRSLCGGLGRPNGETNRNFCFFCDNCGNVLRRGAALVAATAPMGRTGVYEKSDWHR